MEAHAETSRSEGKKFGGDFDAVRAYQELGVGSTPFLGYEALSGQTLSGKWKDGVSTFHGFFVHDFPNLFVVSNIQSGFTAVLDAIERITADGGKVTRTGPNGLFEQAPDEIKGISRAKTRGLINQLVADGVLFIENGIVVTETNSAA